MCHGFHTHASITIPEKTRIAQLVLFKRTSVEGTAASDLPGCLKFTGLQSCVDRCLKMLCTLCLPSATPSEIHLQGLIDTGVDVTILLFSAWPPQWPLDPVELPVAGSGGTAQCFVSQQPVLITNSEGQSAIVTVAIANLWGRDVPAAWGVWVGRDF